MKKMLLIAVLGASVLTGCNYTIEASSNDELKAALPTLSQPEKDMLNVYYKPSFISHYEDTFNAIVRSRIKFGEDPIVRSDNDVPFCDVIEQVVADEMREDSTRSYTLSNQWKTAYGITLSEQCSLLDADVRAKLEAARKIEREKIAKLEADKLNVSESVVSKEAIRVEKILNDVVVVEDDVRLSPALVRELRQSVTDCGRAKNRLMDILGYGEPLTMTHYDDVQKLVLQCEMHLLESDLNK